jgi:chloramphenicol-sensitive protein RarD
VREPIQSHPDARRGAIAAASCYLLWGLVPVYWRRLAAIDPVELIAHRHVWSLVVLSALVAWQGGLVAIRETLRSPRGVAMHVFSASLLTTNWLVYVYGVNTGHVTECSLGYFLVPLVNVLVGRFVLHERMHRLQWLAVAFAALGVALLVAAMGELPWIALALAGSWGAYSLMRKRSTLPALPALSLETMLLSPLALGWLVLCAWRGDGALGRVDAGTHALLLSAGVITAIPLLLFAYGAQRIRLSTLGLLQYVSPSVQLVLGVLVYDEPFPAARAISFACIWVGLCLYTFDGLWLQRRRTAASR